jgi:two-component system nitrate/nitrite response regulator NarL
MPKISVLLADDHPIVREGLKSTLEATGKIKITGEASDGSDAVSLAEKLKPDVILMDISMHGMTGIEAVKQIKNKKLKSKIIALSMHDNKSFIIEMIKAGVNGYVLKDSPPSELIKAIEAVCEGRSFYSSEISDMVFNDYERFLKSSEDDLKKELTNRESQVLLQIVNGLSNKEIAYKMKLSTRTVETHRERIMRKLNIHSVAGLTKFAISKGLIDVS